MTEQAKPPMIYCLDPLAIKERAGDLYKNFTPLDIRRMSYPEAEKKLGWIDVEDVKTSTLEECQKCSEKTICGEFKRTTNLPKNKK